MIKLYNTLTGKKETFKPVKEGKVGLYACGPTVYDYFHIGNARVFITFDVLRRYLAYRGYAVTFVQNYTDIDDKMIKRAAELGITVDELAQRYIKAYEEDAAALGIRLPDQQPRATQHIQQILTVIQQLVERGIAYEVDGDVYYHAQAFPSYGKLSHQPLQELAAGARVEVDPRKRHPMDFALWKKEKPGEPAWESPWGQGRPGWHIECSAMAMHYLGETFDIHAGGQDLIFPHHENEIAQSEGATGNPFARYWMHVGYLNINKEKMSKSLGNVLNVRELCQKADPKAIRFFLLSAHYRSPLNFSPEQLEQAKRALERLNTMLYNIQERLPRLTQGLPDQEEEALLGQLAASKERFVAVMDDDFNTAEAIAVLFELAREVNTYLNRPQGQKENVLRPLLDFYLEVDDIFGFAVDEEINPLEQEIAALIERREDARRRKDWAEADSIRDTLRERGIILEDTPDGVRWRMQETESSSQ